MDVPFKNIVVSGDISTGKSTLAKNLAKSLGWDFFSGGAYFRQWHKEHNISLEDTEIIPEKVDRDFEKDVQNKIRTEEGTVYESQLGGWHARGLKNVFKVLCVADFNVRMERASKRDGVSLEEATENSKIRSEALNRKYKKLYGVEDRFDPKYFDLVVDTTTLGPEEVLQEVLKSMGVK